MSIRNVTLALGLLVLSVFSLASFLMSRAVIGDGFERIEDAQATTDALRAANALEGVLGYLDRLLVDWAYWDDAYEFVQDGNEHFIRSNLTPETFLKQGVAFVAFLDSSGAVAWSGRVDSQQRAFAPLTAGMRAALDPDSPLWPGADPQDHRRGVLLLDGQPFLVSARHLRDSDASMPSRGLAVMGRLLDRELVEELRRGTLLDLDFRPLAPGEAAPQPGGLARLEKTPDAVVSRLVLRDVGGAPALELSVQDERGVMAMGRATFLQNLLWTLVTGAGVGTVFILLLELRILRRVSRIGEQAGRIGQGGDAPRRIDIGGGDELSGLAESINRMLGKIEADEANLRLTEEKYRAVFMNTGTASMLIASDTTIVLANNEFGKLSGYQRSEIENRIGFREFLPPDQAERLFEYHRKRRLDPAFAPRNYETIFRNKAGELRNVHMTVAMIPGTDYSIASLLDITERIQAERQLAHQAFHDSLTGLPNRALLGDRLQHAIQAAAREGLVVGVFLLDLDRFKQVNDSYGHPFGDRLLRQAAERLRRAVRSCDTVARLGGDEFVLVVENQKSVLALASVAQHVLAAFREPFAVDGHEVYLGVSIGVTSYPRDGADPDALVKNADLAMYRSKETGRNTYSLFTRELNDQAVARMALETELHRALESDGFHVVYQPKVDARDRRIVGCEALVRWTGRSGRLVPPAEFIPVAEEMGIVDRLDAWVLATACRQVKLWHDQGFPGLSLAVNFSARSLHDAAVAERIARVLEQTGFPAGLLEVEITETALMTDWDRATSVIGRIAALGARISLDDFGTGHSSLYYLHKLPIGCLKIDRRFMEGVGSASPDAGVLARTIISLAGNLGLDIVAEGVETPGQLTFLMEHGCPVIQGYLFAPPLAPEELRPLLGRPLAPGVVKRP